MKMENDANEINITANSKNENSRKIIENLPLNPLKPLDTQLLSETSAKENDLKNSDRNKDKMSSPAKEKKMSVNETITEQRIRDGCDPDGAEFDRLSMESPETVEREMSCLKKKVVFIHSLTMPELSHPRVMEIMIRCREFNVSYLQRENQKANSDLPCWEGCILLHMATTSDAIEAVKHVQKIRPNLTVQILETYDKPNTIFEKWRSKVCMQMANERQKKITDDLLVVGNLSKTASREDLEKLFPDALEIVLPRDVMPSGDMGEIKGYAYMTFGSSTKKEEAYKTYTSRLNELNGRLLRVLRYEEPKITPLPKAYLRLERRHQIMTLFQSLQSVERKNENVSSAIQKILREGISYTRMLIQKDNSIRRILGVPLPSLEELTQLLDISKETQEAGENMSIDDVLNKLHKERYAIYMLKNIKPKRRYMPHRESSRTVPDEHHRLSDQRRPSYRNLNTNIRYVNSGFRRFSGISRYRVGFSANRSWSSRIYHQRH